MKWTLIVIGVLAVAAVALPLVGLGNGTKTARSARPTAASIRFEINRIRGHAHLKPLKPDQAASLLAAAHSESMAQTGRLVAVPNKDIDPFLHSGRKGGRVPGRSEFQRPIVVADGAPVRRLRRLVRAEVGQVEVVRRARARAHEVIVCAERPRLAGRSTST